jgi:hypothetical protein
MMSEMVIGWRLYQKSLVRIQRNPAVQCLR